MRRCYKRKTQPLHKRRSPHSPINSTGSNANCSVASLNGRLIEPNPDQPQLDGFNVERPEAAQVEKETITYQRRKGKRRDADCVTEQGLRFDDSVPIQTIRLSVPADLAGDFESISETR